MSAADPQPPAEQRAAAELTMDELDQIVEGIEQFIIGDNDELMEIWEPYITKLTALRASIARGSAPSGRQTAPETPTWQPLATAPEDSRVLVATKRGGLLFGCLGWVDDHRVWTDDETGEAISPTHWMPLPSAPVRDPLED